MQKKDIYNKTNEYTNKIEPIIKELKVQCSLNRLPMFVTVAVENSSKGTTYINDLVMASTDVKLKDNRISAVLLRLNGFEQKFPDYIEKNIKELSEYLDRIEERNEQAEHIDVNLKNDMIPDIDNLLHGDRVALPDGIAGKKITQDEATEIEDLSSDINKIIDDFSKKDKK